MNKTQLLDISFGFVKAADGWLDSLSQYLSANPAARNALIGTAAGAGVGGLGSVLTGSKNTLRNTLLGGLLGGAGGGIGTAMLRASDGAQPTRAGGAPPDLLRAMNPALLPGNAVRHALQAPAGKGEAVPDLLRAMNPALLPGNAVTHALHPYPGKGESITPAALAAFLRGGSPEGGAYDRMKLQRLGATPTSAAEAGQLLVKGVKGKLNDAATRAATGVSDISQAMREAPDQAKQKFNSFTDDLADKMFKTTNRMTGVPEQ